MFSTPHVNMCWHDTLCVEHVTWQINLSIPYFFLCMDVLMSRLTSSSNKLVQRNFYSVLIKTYGFFPKKKTERESVAWSYLFRSFHLFLFFYNYEPSWSKKYGQIHFTMIRYYAWWLLVYFPQIQRNMVRFISSCFTGLWFLWHGTNQNILFHQIQPFFSIFFEVDGFDHSSSFSLNVCVTRIKKHALDL
jgi:hypothetical protein